MALIAGRSGAVARRMARSDMPGIVRCGNRDFKFQEHCGHPTHIDSASPRRYTLALTKDSGDQAVPIYEYTCQKCNSKFEQLVRSMGAEAKFACPECGSQKTARTLSVFAVGA